MSQSLISLPIEFERDVVSARQRARQIAALVGFESQDQTRIATAVSEIARNAFTYAGGGRVEFVLEGRTSPQLLVIRVADAGKGIPNLKEILEGNYRSKTGMGVGIVGTKRLMDSFDIQSSPAGTTVWLRKLLPARSPVIAAEQLRRITAELIAHRPEDPLSEIRQQNQELLGTLEELRQRQSELQSLNRELEDTNRGVVALYAELEERADQLRRVDEVKTRFLSNMTHEFRTPVNSILALTDLLTDRADGELNPEQEKQLGFIRKAAQDLSELVNDLLDLAKVEAGKLTVRPAAFEVGDLFGALRGMLRPLLVTQSVTLAFDEPEGVPTLDTDESKLSQILRNFISNALKFTERGEVRVSGMYLPESDAVRFAVADTGIGIAPADIHRIFEEFSQLDNPIQRRVKGTGLGLPLSKRLAELLGGSVGVTSQPGFGSTFTVTIPRAHAAQISPAEIVSQLPPTLAGLIPILAVDDRPDDRLIYERLLRDSRFQLIPANNLRQAKDYLVSSSPKAILLDVMLGNQDAWKFLSEIKADPVWARIPVMMVTSIDDQAKAYSLGADAYGRKPLDRHWLIAELERLVHRRTALIIDDDEAARYTLHQMLRRAGWEAIEAEGGEPGLAVAQSTPVGAVFLDLTMPEMSGYEVLERLRGLPLHQTTTVFISSSAILTAEQQDRLQSHRVQLLPKGMLGPAGIAAALDGVERRARPFDQHPTPAP